MYIYDTNKTVTENINLQAQIEAQESIAEKMGASKTEPSGVLGFINWVVVGIGMTAIGVIVIVGGYLIIRVAIDLIF